MLSVEEIRKIVSECPLPDGVEATVYENTQRFEYPGGPPLVVIQLACMFPGETRRYLVQGYAAKYGRQPDIMGNGGTMERMSDPKEIAQFVDTAVQSIYREDKRRTAAPPLPPDDAFRYTPPPDPGGTGPR